eukprot:21216-Chlamydomonas_euryale.AAC.15
MNSGILSGWQGGEPELMGDHMQVHACMCGDTCPCSTAARHMRSMQLSCMLWTDPKRARVRGMRPRTLGMLGSCLEKMFFSPVR